MVVTGATLLDGTGRDPLAGATIVIRGGTIAAVTPRGVPAPAGAERIDARGKWIIPGLIEARTLGTLEPGKTADLVVLGADPSLSISAIRQIELVMRDGRIVWTSTAGVRSR
ncbi:MAG: hypothetical protein HY294_00245 [Candidatus Rokubacteria bacterium]|nr:hypothetical protein [Candidatus Rokubacteria bacterium]MBI3824409.1 hypothetical protein [Candidatus Rokubacteria bacterium]